MTHNLDVLTLMLLDPCLTTEEATREAAALARVLAEPVPVRRPREPKAERPRPAAIAEDVGFWVL